MPEAAADYAYSELRPLTTHEAETGNVLRLTVAALLAPEEPLWAIVESPGAAVALDPATVDPSWLPLLAEIVGGRLVAGMNVARQRAEVASPSGWLRGRPAHKRDVAAPHLQGQKRVTVRQRYDGVNDDAPGFIEIRVREADVIPGHEEALERDLLADVPAHLLGRVEITNDRDYDEGLATTPTYDIAHATYTDYDDALDGS